VVVAASIILFTLIELNEHSIFLIVIQLQLKMNFALIANSEKLFLKKQNNSVLIALLNNSTRQRFYLKIDKHKNGLYI
jgi:hypothetical protein